ALADDIRAGVSLGDALRPRSAPVESDLPLRRIAEYFSDYDLNALVGGLQGAVGDDWAQEMLELLGNASPTSLWVTAALLEAGKSSSLAECLDRELRAGARICATPDFAEGVRAVLVDKDRNPSFTPATIDAVDQTEVRRIVGE
ncbi:MAG TPA: enoyl-CoA hydratase/isomerase family protein, partial [Gordonia sp. (in: high G+C Gram-positive bacteria)]|nr:enoyl-CoA hydratase/isomerase family protein [Gordonia sp. (in: high G+C Gram-positive bacteria)]